jgi:DNA-binding IclR family transcriptional regulator
VLDKAVAVLTALEAGPRPLGSLTAETGLTRATAHRLAVALEVHGLVRRDGDGRFCLGLRLIGLGSVAARALPGWLDAGPVLARLRAGTGESVQLFVRDGDARVCVESLDGPHELRTIVPVGARLPLDRGSAGKVLMAAGGVDGDRDDDRGPAPAARVGRRTGAAGRAGRGTSQAARRGWAESVAERQEGVASVSAPVRDPAGRVVAAVCVSGPIDRIGPRPGRRHGAAVVAAADEISARLR